MSVRIINWLAVSLQLPKNSTAPVIFEATPETTDPPCHPSRLTGHEWLLSQKNQQRGNHIKTTRSDNFNFPGIRLSSK